MKKAMRFVSQTFANHGIVCDNRILLYLQPPNDRPILLSCTNCHTSAVASLDVTPKYLWTRPGIYGRSDGMVDTVRRCNKGTTPLPTSATGAMVVMVLQDHQFENETIFSRSPAVTLRMSKDCCYRSLAR